jgi:hypothetical protein
VARFGTISSLNYRASQKEYLKMTRVCALDANNLLGDHKQTHWSIEEAYFVVEVRLTSSDAVFILKISQELQA